MHHLTLSSSLTVLPKIQHHPSSPSTTIRVPPPETQNAGRRPYLISGHHELLHEILPTLISMPPTPYHNVLTHTNALPIPAHRKNLIGEPHHHPNRPCSPANHKLLSAGSTPTPILSHTNCQVIHWTRHSSSPRLVPHTTQQNPLIYPPHRAGPAHLNRPRPTHQHPSSNTPPPLQYSQVLSINFSTTSPTNQLPTFTASHLCPPTFLPPSNTAPNLSPNGGISEIVTSPP